ncbi:PadR family transcriptional regulator [Nocardioides sp. dk4132]|uniref:PadR family transcriptional regulator n=1 Tax=unclassified Nocardioides TaxID=2615069 RepID=UPI0012979A44|nr:MULTISPECIES: PadR family transcriptional regulator [unclassified Nocardioides]MQW77045.1 PadR family transcriptional regulator [Nocardioides sp. dk4132]QGA09450.1 PadR family transcriptional regulator [Nocardioides sp. dk884]
MARRGETIELAVLGLLHEGPMHGYELRKRLNLMLGWGRVLSYGSLYPALKKMLRSNLIEEASTTVTPVSRRPRIVYQVTAAGTAEFERLMSEVGPAAWEDDNFDIRFAFFSSTDMEIRLRVLEGRRIRLQERLDRVQSQLSLTEKEVDRYAAELQRHGVESVEREVRWLSDLINAERSAGSPPGPAPGTAYGDPAAPPDVSPDGLAAADHHQQRSPQQ